MGALRNRVEAYFAACNTGSADAIAAHFAENACIYDLNMKPVRGRAVIGRFWFGIFNKWQGAQWRIDSLVADETAGAVAIEWTMAGRRDGADFCVSGSEHYAFEGDLIAEIRQYWIFDSQQPTHRLIDYPYPA